MRKARAEYFKQQLSVVLKTYFATNQTNMHEIKGLIGPFADLVAENTNRQYIKASKRAINHVAKDFQGMLYSIAICDRLTQENNSTDPFMSTMTARALMQTFFLDVRSMFDYMLIATLIIFRSEIKKQSGTFAKKLNRQLERTNFASFLYDLRSFKTDAIGCFGRKLVNLWLGCKWFSRFNSWRNGLAHEGYFLAVNNDNPDLFRLETMHGVFPLQRRLLPSKMFVPDNSVSFASFSGLYAGLMLYLLNKWSEEIHIKAKLPVSSRAYGGRGGTACEKNIKHALKALEIN
jgi:hypothetical protein